MTDLQTTLKDLADARDEVHDIATSLQQEQRHLTSSLRSFLGGGWTGKAADQFSTAWDEWDGAAAEILEGLHTMAALLDHARVDFSTTDQDAGARTAHITVRLGPVGY